MIPYQELDRALARWKARAQGGGAEVVHEGQDISATVVSNAPIPAEAHRPSNGVSETAGEIDLGDDMVETFDDER
jgi:hypothetical protein